MNAHKRFHIAEAKYLRDVDHGSLIEKNSSGVLRDVQPLGQREVVRNNFEDQAKRLNPCEMPASKFGMAEDRIFKH